MHAARHNVRGGFTLQAPSCGRAHWKWHICHAIDSSDVWHLRQVVFPPSYMPAQTESQTRLIQTMSMQRQNFGNSRPAAPKRIPFVVSGRTTLSEHLPAEIIDVPITVAQRSSNLRKAIKRKALDDLTKRPIRLPDVDPTGFRIYIDWLKSGRVEFHTPTSISTGNGLLLRDSFDLIFAHIAGSQLEEADFQDYIIDELSRLLDASQTPDLKVLEVVFLEKGASNTLKQFVIDKMFAVERKMLSMMRGFIGGAETAQGCEYHVHEVGECYRNRAMSERLYTESFASGSHDGFNSRGSSVYNGSEHFQAPTPTLPYRAKSTNAAFYNMAETSYFGSAEWSREVHGLVQNTPMQNLRTDKPLPVIPPLTPGTSPRPPSSLHTLRSSLSNGGNAYPSTQQLISECLARLPHSPAPSGKPSDPDPHASTVPVLILECLERFKRNNTERESSPEFEGSPPQQRHSSLDCSGPLRSPTRRALRTDSAPHRQVSWQPSFDELPELNLGYFRASSTPQQNIPSYRSSSIQPQPRTQRPDSSQSLSYPLSPQSYSSSVQFSLSTPPCLPFLTPSQSIRRKPAPNRGSDWLTQYNLINTLSTTPKPSIITAKRSKKSRFVEMLRSDSLMGRMRVGMGAEWGLEREGSIIRVRSAMD